MWPFTRLRESLGPYFKSHSFWVMRKDDKKVYHHFLSSFCPTLRCLFHNLSWLKIWSLYCTVMDIIVVTNSHVLEISSSSLCFLLFVGLFLKIPNKVHEELYFSFLPLWEPIFLEMKIEGLWSKNKKTWKEGKVYSNYHSLVFPTAMVTAVRKLLQRKEKPDIGKYSFFLSLERKWHSYWPQLIW